MHLYRCYFLNGDDRPEAFELIEAAGLTDAVDSARAMLRARPHHRSIELWEGSRRVYPAVYGNVLPQQRKSTDPQSGDG